MPKLSKAVEAVVRRCIGIAEREADWLDQYVNPQEANGARLVRDQIRLEFGLEVSDEQGKPSRSA